MSFLLHIKFSGDKTTLLLDT